MTEPTAPLTMADVLRAHLAEAGLSQRAAAGQLGIDERQMRRYCSNDAAPPPYVVLALQQLAQIARHKQVLQMLNEGTLKASDGAATRERHERHVATLTRALQILLKDHKRDVEFLDLHGSELHSYEE